MSRLHVPWTARTAAFHVRLGGCCGCGDMVDMLLRGSDRGRPWIMECSSPRHARLIIITGTFDDGLEEALVEVVEQAPEPSRIVVVGDCALGGGPLLEAIAPGRCVTDCLRSDIELGGCPVTPEALSQGIRDVAR
jgi:NADH:ubiquinone oxidoreductase subunit B-like Fe-S oxidoreductase